MIQNLSWVDNSGNEDGFKIFRATTSEGPYTLIAALPANSTLYQDTGLSTETTYYYKLTAFNSTGDSEYAVITGYMGCGNPYEASATTLRNTPPNCSNALSSTAQLWPPNHKMKGVNVLNVIDSDNDIVSITITEITQDEPIKGLGSGDTSPDGSGMGIDTAWVRAERSGNGNGRVYSISFTANDGKGGQCSGSVHVCVLHDQGGAACVDDGQSYDSTLP